MGHRAAKPAPLIEKAGGSTGSDGQAVKGRQDKARSALTKGQTNVK